MGFIPIYKIAGGVKKMSKVFRSFLIVLGVVFSVGLLPTNSNAFYFDLFYGVGAGNANATEVADAGLKIGGGPLFKKLYIVGEFSALSQIISFNVNGKSQWA
jgi:hypothetical protein